MAYELYIFAVCHSFQVRVITYIFNNGVSSFIDSYFAKTNYEKSDINMSDNSTACNFSHILSYLSKPPVKFRLYLQPHLL